MHLSLDQMPYHSTLIVPPSSEAIHVPFMANFVVFAKRIDPMEARLRVFCMTDDREDKTLEQQEHFSEVAKSRDVEVLEGKAQFVEMAGNLIPVTKSGEQLQLCFKAFRENRLPFSVRVKDQHADNVGRALFMREPKVAKGEASQQPICILNIVLPEEIMPDTISILDDQRDVIARINVQEMQKRLMPDNFNYLGEMRIADISNVLGEDWLRLSPEIGVSEIEIQEIIENNPDSTAKQGQAMLRLCQSRKISDRNILENGLKKIGRDDVIKQCIKFNNFAESSNVRRHISVEDERDLMKDSESIEELALTEDSRLKQLHEREEMKYSAEEKIIEDSESEEDEVIRRTVAERRTQIEKRLSVERQFPASTQKKEIVEEITTIKRQSLIEDKKAHHEEEIILNTPVDNVIKSVAIAEPVLKLKSGDRDSKEITKDVFEKELKDKMKVTIKGMEADMDDDDLLLDKEPGMVSSKIHIDTTETEKVSRFDEPSSTTVKETTVVETTSEPQDGLGQTTTKTTTTTTTITQKRVGFQYSDDEEEDEDYDHDHEAYLLREAQSDEVQSERKIHIADAIKREVMDKSDKELMQKLELQKEKIEHSTRMVDDILENATQLVITGVDVKAVTSQMLDEERRSAEREIISKAQGKILGQ